MDCDYSFGCRKLVEEKFWCHGRVREKTVQIADAICFKAALTFMGVIIFPFLLLDGTSPYLTGYLLTGGIFILVLIRAIVFYWIDKNGME